MRTTETMTVSLPPALVYQFEEVRKIESRTRSELVREALRAYFESRYPADSPTRRNFPRYVAAGPPFVAAMQFH